MEDIRMAQLQRYLDEAMARQKELPTDCHLLVWLKWSSIDELLTRTLIEVKPLTGRPHIRRDDYLNALGTRQILYFTRAQVPCNVSTWLITDLESARVRQYCFGKPYERKVKEPKDWHSILRRLMRKL